MSNDNGKRKDVLFRDVIHTDNRTGMQSLSDYVTIFADTGKEKTIESVDGVLSVTNFGRNEYYVKIDPRFDREFVKAEIEAALLCE